jgi:hypothetical protein
MVMVGCGLSFMSVPFLIVAAVSRRDNKAIWGNILFLLFQACLAGYFLSARFKPLGLFRKGLSLPGFLFACLLFYVKIIARGRRTAPIGASALGSAAHADSVWPPWPASPGG